MSGGRATFTSKNTERVWALFQSKDRERALRAFWRTVRKVDGEGCWERWRSRRPARYQYRKFLGTQQHRVSWLIHFGPIPPGLYVCHKCDNHPCVRPDHLFLGTPGQNVVDSYTKRDRSVIPGAPNSMAAEPILEAMRKHGTFAGAARELRVTETSLVAGVKRLGLQVRADALRSELSRKTARKKSGPAAPAKGGRS